MSSAMMVTALPYYVNTVTLLPPGPQALTFKNADTSIKDSFQCKRLILCLSNTAMTTQTSTVRGILK